MIALTPFSTPIFGLKKGNAGFRDPFRNLGIRRTARALARDRRIQRARQLRTVSVVSCLPPAKV